MNGQWGLSDGYPMREHLEGSWLCDGCPPAEARHHADEDPGMVDDLDGEVTYLCVPCLRRRWHRGD